jgi:hypothetical protein
MAAGTVAENVIRNKKTMREEGFINGERVITKSGDGLITLTNQRVRLERISYGQSEVVSIILKKVSSLEIRYKSTPILLVLSLILAVGGGVCLSEGLNNVFWLMIGIAVLLLAAYFRTRTHFITIRSDNSVKIHFKTQGLSTNEVINFINQVENATLKQHAHDVK